MNGLIKSTAATRLSTADWLAVTGITVDATIPDGTVLKLALRTAGGEWKAWSDSAWASLSTQTLTADSLLSEGNTKAEIEALDSTALAWLADEEVEIALALSKGDTADSPQVESISIAGSTGEDVYTKVVESLPLTLSSTGDAVEILAIEQTKSTSGGGTATLTCSMMDGQGVWSEFGALSEAQGKFATAIKLRATLAVTVIGGADSATITSVKLVHRVDNVAVFGEGTGQIVTRTYEFLHEMGRCHLMCKRPIVKDASLRAYVALRSKPIQVTNELLGTGTGAPATYTVAHPEGLAPHTMGIRVNGDYTGVYNLNSATGKITLTAPEGAEVRTEYQYNWELEEWLPMVKDAEYPDTQSPLIVNDQFNYSAGADGDRGSVSAVKIELEQGKGTVTGEELGIATGAPQAFTLAHRPRPHTIVAKGDGTPLESSAYYWHDEGRLLWVTAPNGTVLTADYQWLGLPPSVHSVAAVWNV